MLSLLIYTSSTTLFQKKEDIQHITKSYNNTFRKAAMNIDQLMEMSASGRRKGNLYLKPRVNISLIKT
jgi:hypothetical protein